jgi:hypothetical protein
VLPDANAEAMNLHLAEISRCTTPVSAQPGSRMDCPRRVWRMA